MSASSQESGAVREWFQGDHAEQSSAMDRDGDVEMTPDVPLQSLSQMPSVVDGGGLAMAAQGSTSLISSSSISGRGRLTSSALALSTHDRRADAYDDLSSAKGCLCLSMNHHNKKQTGLPASPSPPPVLFDEGVSPDRSESKAKSRVSDESSANPHADKPLRLDDEDIVREHRFDSMSATRVSDDMDHPMAASSDVSSTVVSGDSASAAAGSASTTASGKVSGKVTASVIDFPSLRELDRLPTEEMKVDYSHDFFQPKFPLGVLAFDLDKTMVRTISLHVDDRPQTPLFDGQYFMFYDEDTTEYHHVYKRPNLEELLTFLRRYVKGKMILMLCTHGTEKYASTILKTCKCDDLFPILLPRREWKRREFDDDYKQRRFKTIQFMANHVSVRVEDVLMIDDDPAVFAKNDRTFGGLVHIKAFDNPTIQKDDRELLKLMKMIRGLLKYGKNFYNIQFAHSIRYTGIANDYTVAAARRREKAKAATEDTIMHGTSADSSSAGADAKHTSEDSDVGLVLRNRLQKEHQKLRCKALWCLMWGLGMGMNKEERLLTLFLFDRFYAHQKIDWQAFYGDHALDEAVIHMFGCLFIARQYLFTDRKRPKQFRRDPRSCLLWQAHVDAYQNTVVKLTQLKTAAKELARKKQKREADAAAAAALAATEADDESVPEPTTLVDTADGADDSGMVIDVSSADGAKPERPIQLTLDVDIESKTSGDQLDEEDLVAESPLSPKDPERDDSPLPHLDNPFIRAHLGHESERRMAEAGRHSLSGGRKSGDTLTVGDAIKEARSKKAAKMSSSGARGSEEAEHPHECYNHLSSMVGVSRKKSAAMKARAGSRRTAVDPVQDAYFEDLNELCKVIRDGISYPYILRGLFSRDDKKADTTLFDQYSHFVEGLFAKVEGTRDITHFDLL